LSSPRFRALAHPPAVASQQEIGELRGVGDRVVAVAVVVDDVHGVLFPLGELDDPAKMLGQFRIVVKIAIALGGRIVARLPGLPPSAMKPDDGQPG